MDLLNKVTQKFKTKSTIVSDAVPCNPDRNGDVSQNRIPPINIEEIIEEESSPHLDSTPIVTEPHNETPPVPPRRRKSKTPRQNKPSNGSDSEDKEIPQTPPINTQASGSVINIINSNGVHVGSSVTCHFGSGESKAPSDDVDSESSVPKTKRIAAVMKAEEKVCFEYMDVLSRNLGAGWRRVCRKLGYTDPMLDTFYETHQHKGIPEVIYQILLDWTRTGERTLGELCTVTWKEGKRLAVLEVANLYKQNNENVD